MEPERIDELLTKYGAAGRQLTEVQEVVADLLDLRNELQLEKELKEFEL